MPKPGAAATADRQNHCFAAYLKLFLTGEYPCAVSHRVRFTVDRSGAVTIDWVTASAGFLILSIGIVYAIFGDDEGGLVALVNDQQERASSFSNDIDSLVTEAESWSPNN